MDRGPAVLSEGRKLELDASDEGLIRFLMRDRHGSPFERNDFRFHIRCSIFAARYLCPPSHRFVQRVQHEVCEGDGRLLTFRTCEVTFGVRSAFSGAYSFEPVSDEPWARGPVRSLSTSADYAFETYGSDFVEAGVACESCPGKVMPVGAYTQFPLDGQRPGADELRLAAQLGVRPAGDPSLRRGGRDLLRRAGCR